MFRETPDTREIFNLLATNEYKFLYSFTSKHCQNDFLRKYQELLKIRDIFQDFIPSKTQEPVGELIPIISLNK